MVEDVKLTKLLSISELKHFSAGESICTEGDPGDEMYLVLKGIVDIYISSMLEGSVQIAQVESGGILGEMAIFEQKPRSATCIARENTACIGIKRDKLQQFIISCPEIVEKMLETLCNRVRELNDRIYRVKPEEKVNKIIPFFLPEGHKSMHREEQSNPKYLSPLYANCPLCHKQIKINNIRNHELSSYKTLKNQRRIYKDFDALWHYIRICPECGYSNYYIHFFNVPKVAEVRIKEVIQEENNYLTECSQVKTAFDKMTANYYRAIHFNTCLNSGNTILLAKLWMYLYWLYSDIENSEMVGYCRKKSLEYYCATYNHDLTFLDTEFSKQQCALIIGELYYEDKDYQKATRYYHEAMRYTNTELSRAAHERILELRRR